MCHSICFLMVGVIRGTQENLCCSSILTLEGTVHVIIALTAVLKGLLTSPLLDCEYKEVSRP